MIAAAKAGKTIALANKEALVVAGSIVMPTAKKHGAIHRPGRFRALRDLPVPAPAQKKKSARSSSPPPAGHSAPGPSPRSKMPPSNEALAHPNWKMGPKITIDSATMMNKALEIIEAHWLFDLPPRKSRSSFIPQSIVHSMIEFVDGSVIAELGTPDMRTPIQYALTHPDRLDGCSSRLDWSKIREMTFEVARRAVPAYNWATK